VVLAVLVLIAAAGYGYLRYRWSQVKTLACPTCTAVVDGQPFNVLLVGSDTRAGNTGQAARSFGTATQVAGQRSDTIKILHVDPASGTARLLSIPRDTFVETSGVPASTGLSSAQKINTAFNNGPTALIATIQNSFGIPIAHFVEVDFQGLTNAVNTVGGIYLNFPYPVRDNDNGNNNSGLVITRTGCQPLNGTMTLALARSRYYQYYANGSWHYDPTSDIGRIERQNIIIQALASRARSSYNPLTLNAFLGAVVHDVTVDRGMSFGDMFSLATKYHALSPGSLQSFTLPTAPGYSRTAGAVEVVQQPQTEQLLMQFLGGAPRTVSTPPLAASGAPITPPPPTTTTTAPKASSGNSQGGHSSSGSGAGASPSASAPPYDPTVCSPS
jgi:LCP family protein required for cell wall assembly